MPKIAIDQLACLDVPDSAETFAGPLGQSFVRPIAKPAGLTRLGATIETLMPGAASSHRHWHDRTDELVVVLEGRLSLHDDAGVTPLDAGDIAVFPAGDANGHCLRNSSTRPATFLVVGSKDALDRCFYADIDLVRQPDGRLTRRDGRPAER